MHVHLQNAGRITTHTEPKRHFKMRRHSNIWEIWETINFYIYVKLEAD